MLISKVKKKIENAFNQVDLMDKSEVLRNVYQSTPLPVVNGISERKPRCYRKVISFALAIIVIAGILTIGVPMIQKHPETKKPEIVFSQSLLTINAYASENAAETKYTKMNVSESICISHGFDPAMSSTIGLGISLEFIYSGATIELISETGSFITWDAESGQVTSVGKSYTIQENGRIFWAPDPSNWNTKHSINAVQVIVKDNEHVISLASIKANPIESGQSSIIYAELEKAVDIPLVNGEYQTIDQEFIHNFFNQE